MIVILKFFQNTKRPDLDTVISRTLMKVAVVSKNYAARSLTSTAHAMPVDKEIWKCRVVKEMYPGEAKGCFIVEPIERVNHENTQYLLPNGYTTEVIHGRLLVHPKTKGNWMLDLMLRKILAEKTGAYCAIVDLEIAENQAPAIPLAGPRAEEEDQG